MENLKRCTKCGEEKELNEFYLRKDNNKFRNKCKICFCKITKKYRQNNLEKVKENNRIYRQNNPEKCKELHKKWCKNNLEKVKENNRRYCKNHPEKRKKSCKRWNENNKKYYREYTFNKRKVNIHYKIRSNISRAISYGLKRRLSSKGGKLTFSFLPYTVDELTKHLESLFQPWMNWKNYGNKAEMWCIDHRHPDSLFHYTSVEDEEFQKCWSLENLQPMEFIENIKKGNKI